MLLANVLAELESSGRIEIANHHAVSRIGHDSKQLTRSAEHQVASGRIKLPKQALKNVAVKLEVIRRCHIDLEFAFAIVIIPCSNKHSILELEWVGRDRINLAAQFVRLRGCDRYQNDARVLQVK